MFLSIVIYRRYIYVDLVFSRFFRKMVFEVSSGLGVDLEERDGEIVRGEFYF